MNTATLTDMRYQYAPPRQVMFLPDATVADAHRYARMGLATRWVLRYTFPARHDRLRAAYDLMRSVDPHFNRSRGF